MTPRLTVTRDFESPPGRWKYTPPETGVTIRGETFRDLYQKTRKHLVANGYPAPEQAEIEDAACRETNPGQRWCVGASSPRPAEDPQHLTLSMAERFLKTVWGAFKSRNLVPREEAERRISVCHGCPKAVSVGGCTGCSGFFAAAMKILGKNPIPDNDPDKRFCGACGCHLPTKVWVPNEVMDVAEKGHEINYWEGCWRRENKDCP